MTRRLLRAISYNPGKVVPLIVAALMIAVSIAVSNLVLTRLAETQAAHFRELTGAFLDGTLDGLEALCPEA